MQEKTTKFWPKLEGGGGGCNRVHLHIVFVLLYVLCVSLCRCSFVCKSFNLLRMCYVLWFRCHYRSEWDSAREGEREEQRPLSYVPSKRKEEIKSGTSGCGSFVVPYFQPATSTDCLHLCRKKCTILINQQRTERSQTAGSWPFKI